MKRKMRFPALLTALALLFFPLAASGQANAGRFTVLLIGTDPAGAEDPLEAGVADAVMVASLDYGTGAVRLLSIQKDIEILLPEGLGQGPLGAASRAGGPELTLAAVNELTRLEVPYFLQIDMSGLQRIVEAVGGLEMNIDEKELSTPAPGGTARVFEKSGLQAVSPEQLMAYLNDPAAIRDQSRGARLMKALGALAKKALGLDAGSLLDVVSELIVYVQSNMTAGDMMNAALNASNVKLSEVKTMRFPQAPAGEGGAQVDIAAQAAAARAFLYGAGE